MLYQILQVALAPSHVRFLLDLPYHIVCMAVRHLNQKYEHTIYTYFFPAWFLSANIVVLKHIH